MSNSPLVEYTKYSPYHTKMTNKKNTVITPHYAASVISVEGLGVVAQTRGGAANYGIGSDARVGLYVDECNSAHTTSNQGNDRKAVTIEVSNSQTDGDWPVSDKVLQKLIDLCVDICVRNEIPYLNYTGDLDGNMTMHAWFDDTGCPGQYLAARFPYIANEVNKRLGTSFKSPEKVSKYDIGDTVKLTSNALYYNNYGCPDWLQGQTMYIRNVYGKYYDVSIYRDSKGITGKVHEKYLVLAENGKENDINVGGQPMTNTLQVGAEIVLTKGAKYTTGKEIPEWVMNSTLYARSILGDIVGFSIFKEGGITGYVNKLYIVQNEVVEPEPDEIPEPDVPKQDEDIPVENEPNETHEFPYMAKVTIVNEKNGFAEIDGGGWIELTKIEKV